MCGIVGIGSRHDAAPSPDIEVIARVDSLAHRVPLNRHRFQQATPAYLAGDASAEPLLKQLLSIAIWHDACCRARASPPVAA